MAGERLADRVTSPVAGTVNLFMVDDGAQVEADEQIMALESMKTLFYVNAPSGGVVTLKCNLGDVVSRGQLLCEIRSN